MAQAIVWQVPNLAQAVVDSTAGTLTYQTWDTSTSSWVTQWTLALSTGDITVAQSQTVSGNQTVSGTQSVTGAVTLSSTLATGGAISDNEALNSQAGETAGTIYWSMPMQGTSWKFVAVYLDAYENDTTTANVITFPTAFTYIPYLDNVVGVPGTSASTTALSIDPDNTTTYTGWIFVYGF